MTDRDLFAMHAMAALVAQQKPHNCPSCGGYNKKSAHVTLAEMAYVIADAMMDARAKGGNVSVESVLAEKAEREAAERRR